jgi:TonB family protein
MKLAFRATTLVAFVLMSRATVVVRASPPERAWLNPDSHGESTAVDAHGRHHRAEDYPGNPPWLLDTIRTVAPDYPESERRQRHQGGAIIHVTLDLKTGSVVAATLTRSTGFTTLDASALTAFRQWRWKPGKWKEMTISVRFRIHDTTTPLPSGAVRIPHL